MAFEGRLRKNEACEAQFKLVGSVGCRHVDESSESNESPTRQGHVSEFCFRLASDTKTQSRSKESERTLKKEPFLVLTIARFVCSPSGGKF